MPSTLKCGLLPVSTMEAGLITSDFHILWPFSLESIILRCIHIGLRTFSRVPLPIRMHDQAILTRSFDPVYRRQYGVAVFESPKIGCSPARTRLRNSDFVLLDIRTSSLANVGGPIKILLDLNMLFIMII